MRASEIKRKTGETDITLNLDLDGVGNSKINTGGGFLDHMLTLFAKHSHFDLTVDCKGDTYVDYHHTVEDVGICLGMAFLEALGDKKGIVRFADKTVPMDEALVLVAVDISGRGYLGYSLDVPSYRVGDFDTELSEEFFAAFVRTCACTLHIRKIAGTNSHHIIEGTFKSVARSLRAAVAIDAANADALPSTKGVL